MSTEKDIPPREIDTLASLCKAAGDPLRLEILRVLQKDSFGVQELASIFAMAQPGMSHHLKVMTQAGLVESRRQGNSIFYRRPFFNGERGHRELLVQLFRDVDEQAMPDHCIAGIESVYQARAERSRAFFDKNVDEFENRQRQLCEWDEYQKATLDLLDFLSPQKTGIALEVGPGQGHLLKELATHYRRVIALDSSESMLELARKYVEDLSDQPIEFHGTAFEKFRYPSKFDLVVFNMVLHHMSSPSNVFRQTKEMLNQGGKLLIVDLCPHTQNWVRESCGDLWLGFDPEELDRWAGEADMVEQQSLYLGLKNGFQILLKVYVFNPA